MVLTETNGGIGTRALSEGLSARGYESHLTPTGQDRGVIVASRVPVVRTLTELTDVTLPWRVSGLLLDTNPRVAVVGVYVPSRDRSEAKIARKQEFITSLLEAIERLPEQIRHQLILVGDYNVISRSHRPSYRGFFSYEYEMHDQLARLGFVAAHAVRPRRVQPYSWIGRTGNGYLYDYVHVGQGLHQSVERCMYLHGSRLTGLSDHAAVAVRLKIAEESQERALGRVGQGPILAERARSVASEDSG